MLSYYVILPVPDAPAEADNTCTSPSHKVALAGSIRKAAGGALIVIVFVAVAAPQLPLPFAVNVNVRLPAVISAALGL